MAAPTRRTAAELALVASRIFGTALNPTAQRTGRKVLRRRLVGPMLESACCTQCPCARALVL